MTEAQKIALINTGPVWDGRTDEAKVSTLRALTRKGLIEMTEDSAHARCKLTREGAMMIDGWMEDFA